MKKIVYGCIVLFLFSCSEKEPIAQEIIDKTIENYGREAVCNSDVSFTFRDKQYRALYENENYQLERVFEDSLRVFKDVLTSDNFVRTINDSVVELTDEWIGKYSNSINSVVYFFRIPFHLNEKAVNKKLLGTSQINGVDYYKIKVWFDKAGGGKDFSDIFIYWVNKATYNIDFLAYSYETDGGGKRFREMVNPRRVNGLLVVDYINYKPKDTIISIENFDKYFQQGGMEKLSEIINENVIVQYFAK